MNSILKFPVTTLLTLAGVLLAASPGQAQILVKVDTTKPWLGFMNVSDLPANGGAYRFGSTWGTAALTAFFTGTNTLTLMPNTNTYNPADPYWVNPDGTGNKIMEANFYIENTGLRGQTVTFTLTVLSNNLFKAANGHVTQAFVKTLDSASNYQLVPGAYEFVELTNSTTPYTISITVNVPAGASMVPQYGFVTTGPDANPAWVATNGIVSIAVDNSDPSITGQPANRRVQIGGTASFTVTAIGGSSLSYHWKRYGTNLLNGGNISGATNATLTISNAQPSDATIYSVTVTDTAGSLDSDPAILRVKTPAEFANALDNPGFEDPLLDPVTLIPTPWNNFAGAGIRNTNDNYGFVAGFPIQTIDGTNAGYAYNGGEYNGVFQDVTAAPGDVFTADANFYLSSQELLFGTISGWLEVQFRNGGAIINLYKSTNVDSTSLLDNWFILPATNGLAGDLVTPIPNARYLVAPAGTTSVRYQVTVHALLGSGGAINYDGMLLMKKIPTTVGSSATGGSIVLTWLSQAATSYQVVYKDHLTDPTWTPIGGTVPGDGTVKTASFLTTESQRFYAVLTL
jgi:hypothetical protein